MAGSRKVTGNMARVKWRQNGAVKVKILWRSAGKLGRECVMREGMRRGGCGEQMMVMILGGGERVLKAEGSSTARRDKI